MNREQFEIELIKRGFKYLEASDIWKKGDLEIAYDVVKNQHPDTYTLLLKEVERIDDD